MAQSEYSREAFFLFEGVLTVQTAADYFRQCLEFIHASPPEDDNRRVVSHDAPSHVASTTSVKENLKQLKQHLAETNLASLKGRVSLADMEELGKVAHRNISVNTKMVAQAHYDAQGQGKLLFQRSMAGGKECDCCKKGIDELEMEELLRCGRCMMAFYCSLECQRRAWRCGHKQACRKKGQIEIGDDMMLRGLVNRSELNGSFVVVVGKGNEKNGKWLVKLSALDQPMLVSGDKLVRLRPTA